MSGNRLIGYQYDTSMNVTILTFDGYINVICGETYYVKPEENKKVEIYSAKTRLKDLASEMGYKLTEMNLESKKPKEKRFYPGSTFTVGSQKYMLCHHSTSAEFCIVNTVDASLISKFNKSDYYLNITEMYLTAEQLKVWTPCKIAIEADTYERKAS